jgi:hypothetical protein
MNICDHRAHIFNRSLSVRNRRMGDFNSILGICNPRVSILNRDLGICNPRVGVSDNDVVCNRQFNLTTGSLVSTGEGLTTNVQ